MSFGENVKWRRISLGMTQADLARQVIIHKKPVDRSLVCRVESGEVDPRLSLIKAIAKALGVKPWMLLTELYEANEFWSAYLQLSGAKKREVQRLMQWYLNGGL